VTGFPWAAFAANLGWSALAAFAVMAATFAVAVAKGVHRVVDVAWGLAFAAVAVATYGASAGHGDGGRRLLVTLATVVWGVRLAVHIGRRGAGHGEDPRYERMLAKAPGNRDAYALRTVYLTQGALVWLVSLPVQAAQYAPGALGGWAAAGGVLWAGGLAFEAVGDRQLARFKADPAHHGMIMDRGLWSWTRHPNYFGDFLVWWGLYVMACASPQSAAVGALSPLLMSYLLVFGSGKRMLERHMADRPGFAEYAARTSGFLPRPPRRTGRT
jgi:steroid 5-alpha reductase family enzyme